MGKTIMTATGELIKSKYEADSTPSDDESNGTPSILSQIRVIVKYGAIPFAIGTILAIVLIWFLVNIDSESYHGRGSWTVRFRKQDPEDHPNCDGCPQRPGYKDQINHDYLYRAYMRNTSPYAYDNNRFCTTYAYNTCDGRRSGSRDVNTGKWCQLQLQ